MLARKEDRQSGGRRLGSVVLMLNLSDIIKLVRRKLYWGAVDNELTERRRRKGRRAVE
jgi:hypothetical protein